MAEPTVSCDFCAEPAPAGVRFCPSCGEPFGPRTAPPPAAPRPPRSRGCACLLLALLGGLAFAVVASVSAAVQWSLRRRDEVARETAERDLLWRAEAAATTSEVEALAAQVPAERRGAFAGRLAAVSREEALRSEDPARLRAWLERYPDAPEGWSVRDVLTHLEAEAARAADLAADEAAFEAALSAGDPAQYLARHPLPTYATEEERAMSLSPGLHPTSWTGELGPRQPGSPWVHAALEYLRGALSRPRRARAVERVVEALVEDADPDRRAIGSLLADARRAGAPVVLRLDGCGSPYDERLKDLVRGKLEALDVRLEVVQAPAEASGPATLSVDLSRATDPSVTYDGVVPRELVTARFSRAGWEATYVAQTPMYFSMSLGEASPVARATADELARLDLFPW